MYAREREREENRRRRSSEESGEKKYNRDFFVVVYRFRVSLEFFGFPHIVYICCDERERLKPRRRGSDEWERETIIGTSLPLSSGFESLRSSSPSTYSLYMWLWEREIEGERQRERERERERKRNRPLKTKEKWGKWLGTYTVIICFSFYNLALLDSFLCSLWWQRTQSVSG